MAKAALHAHDQVVRLQIVGQGIAHGAKFTAHRGEEDTELIHAAYLLQNRERHPDMRFGRKKQEERLRLRRHQSLVPILIALATSDEGWTLA
jgi:hypothetical protein